MTDCEETRHQGNGDNLENSYGGGSSPQPRSDDQNDSKSQHGSRDYERESSRSREKEREKVRDKEREKDRDHHRDRDRDREKDRDRDRHHRDRHRDRSRERSERRDRGRDRDDDDYYRSRDYDRRRDYDRDRKDRPGRSSRSHSRGRSERRSKSRSRSRSRSRSKSKRVSGFDMAPPTSAMLAAGAAAAATAGQIPGTSPTLPGVFPSIFPLATTQPFGALPVMPVQAMTQQATRHARRVYVGGLSPTANEQSVAIFFSQVMAAIGGNTAGPGDAVVNVYINHEKKFAFVEMRSVEEASNAMALDGIIFEGAPVKVRRPSDYNPSLAATLGPSQPSPNLNLAAVGLTQGSSGGLEGPDRIFVGGLPYYFTEAQIRELLESFGPLRGFDLVKDRETGNSKGYAFCVYQDLSVTDIACAALNGIKMGDKTLTIRRANQGATQPKPEQESVLQHAQQQIALQRLILQPQGVPTKVVCLTQALNVDDLRDDEEYEDIVEDMRQEGGKYGELVNVVIPRPNAKSKFCRKTKQEKVSENSSFKRTEQAKMRPEFASPSSSSSSSADRRLNALVRHLATASMVSQTAVAFSPTSGFHGDSVFSHVVRAPEDPILGVTVAYNKDPSPVKLNLGVGAYRTEEGKPLVLNVVRKAEQMLLNDKSRVKEYLPIVGIAEFNKLSAKLIFGADSPAIRENRVTTVQCLSGTGSLRVGAEFLARHYHQKTIYIPQPTWGNHPKVFTLAGLSVKTYRYYDPTTRGMNFQGLLEDLGSAPSGSIVLLHACAHNPTGVDPTLQQWEQIRQLMRSKALLPFFDSAYQGFASGNLDEDAQSIRMFVADGGECFVAQSYAKNMGLYGERVGALSVVCRAADVASKVESQLKLVIRPMFSNPPIHGASIVVTILKDSNMFNEWTIELKAMADRIISMRKQLFDALRARGTPGDWSHIIKQIGMFTFTGLNSKQVEFMTREYHIYMTSDGRISMAGLSSKTVPHLADAIHDAVTRMS